MEIDEIQVDEELWKKTLAGDMQAKDELRKRVNGLQLAFHAMPQIEGHVCINLREAEDADIVDSVEIKNWSREA